MKKWGILIGGLILGFIITTKAQTDMNTLFSSGNKNILYSGQGKDYTGSPLVFIEGISDKPQPKGWMDEMKIKLFGSMELPKQQIQKPLPPLKQNNIQNSVKITSVFGGQKEVAFVPHTSDWSFIIQILNDEEIVVQEEIQFIKTADIHPPIRNWPKQNLQLLEVKINGISVPTKLQEENDITKLILPELETGVHRLHLSYLIKGNNLFAKSEAQVKLPLTDTGWNLPVDSLNGVVLFPKEIKESAVHFLLGKNKQEIPGSFTVEKDNSGAVFFKATHLMPASVSIQLDMYLKFDSFIHKGLWNKLSESTSFLVFLISLGIILGYLILNVIEIKITPIEEVITQPKSYFDRGVLKSFLKRTQEIWIGLFLLWGGTFLILKIINTSLEIFEIQFLFLIPIVFVLGIDYLLLYPRQEKIKKIRGNIK